MELAKDDLRFVVTRIPRDAHSQGETVEDRMGRVIGGLLREVDPNIVLDGMEPVDEHETINNSETSHGT